MENVARRAGVSTKTLYRVVPNRARLLKELVSDRFDQFVIDFKLRVPNHAAFEVGLHQALTFCANVALDHDIVALRRLILREMSRSPELAAAFYESSIARIFGELSKWLSEEVSHGSIFINDCEEAAGFLIGVLVSAPLRENLLRGQADALGTADRAARSILRRSGSQWVPDQLSGKRTCPQREAWRAIDPMNGHFDGIPTVAQ
jgi:AcrR family transcriptional regulator